MMNLSTRTNNRRIMSSLQLLSSMIFLLLNNCQFSNGFTNPSVRAYIAKRASSSSSYQQLTMSSTSMDFSNNTLFNDFDGVAAASLDGSRIIMEQSNIDDDTTKSVKATSVSAATFNLVKAVVGSGVLALPSGVAAVSDFPMALVPAIALVSVLGTLSAYTFYILGKLCAVHPSATSLGDLWEEVQGEDSKYSWVVSLATASFCFGCTLAFSILIGDSLSSLIRAALSSSAMATTTWSALASARQSSILLVTLSILWPLCRLKSLSALAPMSIAGVMSTIITTIFMGWRCPSLFANSPYFHNGIAAAAGTAATSVGGYISTLSKIPQFHTKALSRIFSPASLLITSMAATSFVGHFSCPDFYRSFLDDSAISNATPSPASSKSSGGGTGSSILSKYKSVTIGGYLGVIIINVLIMAFGFLTFGGASEGCVLNNYSTVDWGAGLSRFLMMLSVIGGYPFLFRAAKGSLLQMITRGKQLTEKAENRVTDLCLLAVTALSLIMSNSGFVVSFTGALMGSAIIYIFPSVLFLKETSKNKPNSIAINSRVNFHRRMSKALIGFGTVAGLLGAAVSVCNAFFPHILHS